MRSKIALIFLITLSLFASNAFSQEATSIFNFLNLPTSAHATALGGKNVSLIEDDASIAFQNPALMSNVSDRTIGFNFMTYMKGSNSGSLNYIQQTGKRGNWGVGAQFTGYGSITETNETGEVLGTTRALDMNLNGGYSYMLSDRWSGGVYGKFLYSYYAGYKSIGLAVDLGMNYYNEDKDFSFSTVFSNLGGQVRAFGDVKEKLPMDMQLGFTKGLGFIPVRVHFTMYDMFHWKSSYYYNAGNTTKGFQVFLNHINLGADITFWQGRIWAGLGYNFRRGYEMKAAGSSHAAGLTVGAGINIKRIVFGVAYSNYHVGAPTIDFTLAYSFPRKRTPKKVDTTTPEAAGTPVTAPTETSSPTEQ